MCVYVSMESYLPAAMLLIVLPPRLLSCGKDGDPSQQQEAWWQQSLQGQGSRVYRVSVGKLCYND